MVQTRRKTAEELIRIDGHPVLVNRKAIKNLILRVRPDGSLSLSLPRSCSLEAAERFVRSKEAWITKTTLTSWARESAAKRTASL